MADRPFRVLFACIGNSARSQMAEGWCRHLAGDRVECRSGGSRPLGYVLPEAVEVMREKGIDISGHPSQGFDEAWIRDECDLVVTMGCGIGRSSFGHASEQSSFGDDACPAFIGKRIEDWALPDPKGQDLETFRKVRDEIEQRVRELLKREGVL